MSVYCDPLEARKPSKAWAWSHSARLFADTADELHALARQIGLKRHWFQDEGFFPHYTLTANKRKQALQIGVKPLSQIEAVAKWQEISQNEHPKNR